jgi:hypothetical protein
MSTVLSNDFMETPQAFLLSDGRATHLSIRNTCQGVAVMGLVFFGLMMISIRNKFMVG